MLGGLVWVIGLVSGLAAGGSPVTLLIAVTPVLIGGFILLAADRLPPRSGDR